MTLNVEVVKNGSENAMSVIRKFSRKIQSTGIIRHVRKNRYRSRPLSKAMLKKNALRKIEKRAEYEQLVKDGKIPEKSNHNKTNRR